MPYKYENREPEKSFKFPPKQYAMKSSKTVYVIRYCYGEWFRKFDFISYSKSEDGLYCLACVLFCTAVKIRVKLHC